MLINNDQELRKLYLFCALQFVAVLGGMLVFFRPIDKGNLFWIGASTILGIYLSGTMRRRYMSHFGPRGQEDAFKDLEETLKDLRSREDQTKNGP